MDGSLDINCISVFLRRQTRAYVNSSGVCKEHLSAPLSTSNLNCQQHPFLGAAVRDQEDYKQRLAMEVTGDLENVTCEYRLNEL